MISSIFGRTKPINFIFLGLFALVFLLLHYWFGDPGGFLLSRLPDLLLTATLIIFTILLLEFINRKNTLTKDNSYLSYFFLLYLCMFPRIFADLQERERERDSHVDLLVQSAKERGGGGGGGKDREKSTVR